MSTGCAATRWARSITCRCRSFRKCCAPRCEVFAELFRKTRELERLNAELERRVAERTAELEASNARLLESEQGSCALATEAAEMGSWDVDTVTDTLFWPTRVKRHVRRSRRTLSSDAWQISTPGLHPDDRRRCSAACAAACDRQKRALYDVEYRAVGKEDGEIRWVRGTGPRSLRRRWQMRARDRHRTSTSPTARKPRSVRCCWRARSIIAPAMRSP